MGKRKLLLLRLLSLFRPYTGSLACIASCLLLYTGLSLASPLLSKYLIDEGILKQDYARVLSTAGLMAVLATATFVVEILKEFLRSKIAAGIKSALFCDGFSSLLGINIAYFKDTSSAVILKNLDTDISNIAKICDSNVFFVLTQLLSLMGGLAGLFLIDKRLLVLVLLFIPVKYAVVAYFGKKKEAVVASLIASFEDFARWFSDTVDGIKEVRLFGLGAKKKQDFACIADKVVRQERVLFFYDNVNGSLDVYLISLLAALIYVTGAKFIFDGSLSLGSMFAFITYSANVINPVAAVLNLGFILSGILPSAGRYFSLLEDGEKNRERDGALPLDGIERIEFRNVFFSHGDKKVLEGVSFSMGKGERVALVGKNGAGKSTIFHLLQRFYEPEAGAVLVNDVENALYDLESYRDSFACINQDSYIFNASIMDNITLLRRIAPEKLAFVLDYCGLRELHETRGVGTVGQNGCHLSGGQRQKVLLARMLVQDKSVYLFDEATSSLDLEAEQSFFSAFDAFLAGRTIFMIAHQPDFLQYMTRILYLDGEGSLAEFSSFQELRERHPDLLKELYTGGRQASDES